MKKVDILAQHWSTIQGVLFPFLKEKLGPMSEFHSRFIYTIELVRVENFIKNYSGYRGRPPSDRVPIAHAFIAKAMLNLPSTISLIERLKVDKILRRLCGFDQIKNIPSEPTFSRVFNEFAFSQITEKIHEELIKNNLGDHLFGHVSRDSTAIIAPEKRKRIQKSASNVSSVDSVNSVSSIEKRLDSVEDEAELFEPELESESSELLAENKEPTSVEAFDPIDIVDTVDTVKEVMSGIKNKRKPAKRKRGRPKGSKKKVELPSRLERQPGMSLEEMLADLPKSCDLGCKMSKGYKETWKGYKLHIDVSDGQIPISCILTSASLYDSQAAIPLSLLTSQRITNLYDLMDSAYDSAIIKEHSRSLGHVPIIEMNPRRNQEKQKEFKAEPKRLRLLNIQMPAAVRYNERNSVERVNARLKNEFGGKMVRVRGHAKVMAHLMFGILALTVDQLMRFII